MEKVYKVKWKQGDGYIVAVTNGVGDGPIHISTDGPNEGLDREQTITVETGVGATHDITPPLFENIAERESLYDSDGEQLMTNDSLGLMSIVSKSVEVLVKQKGKRIRFRTKDGSRLLGKDNTMFNCLKHI